MKPNEIAFGAGFGLVAGLGAIFILAQVAPVLILIGGTCLVAKSIMDGNDKNEQSMDR